MSIPLTTTIAVRDKDGRVVDEEEVVTYAGLLAKAYDDGLTSVETTLLHAPIEENDYLVIVHARVATGRGTFCGIGDAHRSNVSRTVGTALVRMAETRAKARALRDAVNIGIVAVEELGDLSGEGHAPVETLPNRRPPNRRADPRPMSYAQHRLLNRLLQDRGCLEHNLDQTLCEVADVPSLDAISGRMASALIDRLHNQAA